MSSLTQSWYSYSRPNSTKCKFGSYIFKYSDLTYPEYAGEIVNDPLDKKSNITLGMYYLKVISDEFGCTISNNPHAILTSYNRGSSNAQGYYKNHGTYATPYSEEILRAAEYIREHKSWKEGL